MTTTVRKRGLEGKRKDVVEVHPGKLTIVGLDVPLKLPSALDHPLYDPERVALPLSDELVANVKLRGVVLPVICRRTPTAVEVVDGKQRVRAARKAEVVVPILYVDKGMSDEALRCLMRELNEHRVDDPPSVKAAQARRLITAGVSQEDVAASFGIKPPMLKRYVALANTAPEVQKAVDEHKMTLTEATTKVAKLPEKEQKAVAVERETKPKPKAPKKPTRRLVLAVAWALDGKKLPARELLLWAVGAGDALGVAELKKAIEASRVKRGKAK